MSTIKKVIIIGLGEIGFRYDNKLPKNSHVLTHSRAFHLHPNFKIIGAVDYKLKNRKAFSELYSCKVFSNINDAFKKNIPNVVVVATPTETHFEVITRIFKIFSPEFIVCEKPLAYSLKEGEEIISLCEKNNSQIFVNYMRNSSSVVEKISNQIKNKKILNPFKIVQWYSKGISNSASHFINLFNDLFGKPLELKLLNKPKKILHNDYDCDFKIRYSNCEVFFISCDYQNYFYNSFKLLAKNGMLLYENGGEFISWFPLSSNGIYSDYKIIDRKPLTFDSNFTTMQLDFTNNLYKKINGQNANICSGKDALFTMKILNNILNLADEK